MSLEYKLAVKFLALEKKLIKAKQALLYLQNLINKIKKSIKDEEIRQIYIRKELEVVDIEILIKKYSYELSIYIKHQSIMPINDKRINKVLALINEFEERISDVITTLQSMIIFLEHSE